MWTQEQEGKVKKSPSMKDAMFQGVWRFFFFFFEVLLKGKENELSTTPIIVYIFN